MGLGFKACCVWDFKWPAGSRIYRLEFVQSVGVRVADTVSGQGLFVI